MAPDGHCMSAKRIPDGYRAAAPPARGSVGRKAGASNPGNLNLLATLRSQDPEVREQTRQALKAHGQERVCLAGKSFEK